MGVPALAAQVITHTDLDNPLLEFRVKCLEFRGAVGAVLSPFYYESAPTGRAESLGRRCARNYSKFDTKFDKENDEVFLCQPCIAKTCNVHHFPEKF